MVKKTRRPNKAGDANNHRRDANNHRRDANRRDIRPIITDNKLEKLIKRAKTPQGKRFLQTLQPQVNEDNKNLLLLKGHKTSNTGVEILKSLHQWRKPYAKILTKNQNRLIEAMDKPDDFQYLASKNHSTIFALTNSTKKRPLRLFLGRLFNDQLYDLFEFDVLHFRNFKPRPKAIEVPLEGSKPLVVFQGALWDLKPDLQHAKNILADLFGGIQAEKILLSGFDHAWCITIYQPSNSTAPNLDADAQDDSMVPDTSIIPRVASGGGKLDGESFLIRIDHFYLKMVKSESSPLPDVRLIDIGPSYILKPARTRLPDASTEKAALRVPTEHFKKKVKNISSNKLEETTAKVHVNKEDYVKLSLRHRSKKNKESVDTLPHKRSVVSQDGEKRKLQRLSCQ